MGANSSTSIVNNKVDIANVQNANTKMVQNVLAIWLDINITEDSKHCQNTIAHLRKLVHTVKTFTNEADCMKFIEEVKNEKVCMVTSGSLGRNVMPRIHDISQVNSIFIFCVNRQFHEQWAKNWPKVKGVYSNMKLMCNDLKQSIDDCEQDAIGFSLVPKETDVSTVNLNQLDSMFVYTQIIKEILLLSKFDREEFLNFIEYCRDIFDHGSEEELNNISFFEQNYPKKAPIWWYTWDSFLRPMLNRSLRLSDADVIIKMGFFIGDLCRQIDDLYQQQLTSDHGQQFTVYRGQSMSKIDFEKVAATKDGLISFNNFLFTSASEDISIGFAQHALRSADMVGVLFTMHIDPTQSTASFASVIEVDAYKDEQNEILFSMHTVFRIRTIEQMNDNSRLFRVHLELVTDNDRDFQILTKRIHEETCPDEKGWSRFGSVLLKFGKAKQAEEIYIILLQQETQENKTGWHFNHLGQCQQEQGEYHKAIRLYEKSIETYQKHLPNDLGLVSTYQNIGMLYYKLGDFKKALSFSETALALQQQLLSSKHLDLVKSYHNIGLIYQHMGEYEKALSYYEACLAIQQKLFDSRHHDLISSYNNIGSMHFNMQNYPEALSSFENALTIKEQSLSVNHRSLASSHNNIGSVYFRMGEYAKALSSFEKAVKIKQQSDHPDLAKSYNNIASVYFIMKKYDKALSFYEQALAIQKQSLPSNHPDLATSYSNIGLLHEILEHYAEAYVYHEKAVKIGEQSLPENHPKLKHWKNQLNRLKTKS